MQGREVREADVQRGVQGHCVLVAVNGRWDAVKGLHSDAHVGPHLGRHHRWRRHRVPITALEEVQDPLEEGHGLLEALLRAEALCPAERLPSASRQALRAALGCGLLVGQGLLLQVRDPRLGATWACRVAARLTVSCTWLGGGRCRTAAGDATLRRTVRVAGAGRLPQLNIGGNRGPPLRRRRRQGVLLLILLLRRRARPRSWLRSLLLL
mmetsp:Transcript_80199/g.179574  ORF Transcript_80199/g.179574 Transcript_80199/m.179574 type:complete len:210 (-) Transcript_80199:1243-1872(-)